jgi:outer membrane protein OmpA-like peptidoglycan-associated protein
MKLNKKISFLVLIFALVVVPLGAQIGRGHRYFADGKYALAIPAYEKGLRKKSDVKAMENLANCYRITKNYPKAEEWFAKTLAANPNASPQVHLHYGMVLRNNGKTAEARQQFKTYLGLAPNDRVAENQVRALDDMQVWSTQVPIYDVRNVQTLNSPQSDFSPAFLGNKIMFVSDRGEMDLLNGENASVTARAFLSIYEATKKSENEDSITFAKVKKLPRKLNKEFHNGPVSITEDGQLMAFNRVDGQLRLKAKKYVNRPKIFFCQRKGNGWGSPKPFQFNSNEYSVAHPALSHDGQVLYFTSDMPGGQGGKDIWMCKREGEGWSQPQNLGTPVNTPGDEVFPCIRKDGMLYFSSDGHLGIGGLDIFQCANEKGKWMEVVNQGMPLNSATDDFGMVFNEEGSRGYFSSDRPGGLGSDDIYSFKVTSKFLRISGKLLSSKNPNDVVPNTKVDLMTADGKIVKSTTSDAQGNFVFNNLASDNNYIVRMDENDPAIAARKKYFMADEKNAPVRVTVLDEVGGKFTFQNLPIDPTAPPQLLSDDDYLTIAGNLISDGQPPQPIANTQVLLKDENGKVVQQTTTNAFGAFTFTHIPPDKSYIVAVDENVDPALLSKSKISITNKSGKELMSTRPDANGKFFFKILREDQTTLNAMSVTDTDLRLDLRGTLTGADSAKTLLPNATVNIIDAQGKILQTTKTDDKGYFNFQNLPADESFMVTVDGVNDAGLMGLGKLYIRDANGKVVKILRLNANGKFEFRVLPLDRVTLGTVYVDDPWLQVLQMKAKQQKDSLLIIENIYYDYGDFKILPAAEITLEKVVKVMQIDPNIIIEISSHTDSRSTNEYNMTLSKKRAQAVVDYLVKRGIDKSRLTPVGYGETKVLNKCVDGAECTEEEHAKNRRTEFKINRKQ